MILLDDDIYNETKQLALGRSKPGPLLAEFSEWFMQTHSARVLNFQFGRLPLAGASRCRLYVILAATEDGGRLYQEHEAAVAAAFRRMALKHRFAQGQLDDFAVWYNNFADEARTEANRKATPQLRAWAQARYPGAAIWEVQAAFTTSVAFYYREADIALNEGRGINNAMRETYYALLQRHDELHAYTRDTMQLRFDSKENVDRNYAGNLFYYFR
jgi:hypothetical protein